MLINLWKSYPKKKPKKNGWYVCTVDVYGKQRYVMDLYYYTSNDTWIDNRRKTVYENFYMSEATTIKDTTNAGIKALNSHLVNRTSSVIYWKRCQKPNMKNFGISK